MKLCASHIHSSSHNTCPEWRNCNNLSICNHTPTSGEDELACSDVEIVLLIQQPTPVESSAVYMFVMAKSTDDDEATAYTSLLYSSVA